MKGSFAAIHPIGNPTSFTLVLFLNLVLAGSATAGIPYGLDSIVIPKGYTLKHGLGDDSYFGGIVKDGGLSIGFDIGIGAGRTVQPQDKAKYIWFRETLIGGSRAYLALHKQEGLKLFSVTFDANGANFSIEYHSEADIAEMISILSTYKPK